MSVKNLFMMIFMVVVFPLMIIFCDINAFFVIMSIALVILSLGSLQTLVYPSYIDDEQEEWELKEEESLSDVSESLGINVRRLNCGFVIAMDLIIIIYFIYAFFILEILFLKAIAIILIADWIYDGVRVIDNMVNAEEDDSDDEYNWKDRVYELYLWIHNIVSIGFIVLTFYFRYIL